MDKTNLINNLRGKGLDELRDALIKILLDYGSPSSSFRTSFGPVAIV